MESIQKSKQDPDFNPAAGFELESRQYYYVRAMFGILAAAALLTSCQCIPMQTGRLNCVLIVMYLLTSVWNDAKRECINGLIKIFM